MEEKIDIQDLLEPKKPNFYVKDISPHRKRIKYILYFLSVLYLLLGIFNPSLIYPEHRKTFIIVAIINVIYHVYYWTVLYKNLHDPWSIAKAASPFVIFPTILAYYSGGYFLSATIIVIITTIMVFKSSQLLFLTLIELTTIAIVFFTDWIAGQLTANTIQNTEVLILTAGAVGLSSVMTTFEVQEKEQKMVHLEEMDHIKSTFVAIISHNLRTPLTIIKGSLESLENMKEQLSVQTNEMVENIKVGTHHLSTLIENAITISSFQSGDIKLKTDPVDVNTLIQNVIDDRLKLRAEEKNVKLLYEPDKNTAYTLNGDQKYLKIALHNVIGNAIKFTENGQVKVQTEQKGTEILIKVSDTGKGIPEDFQKNLFTQFSREGSILTYDQKGVGLGLYISKLIIEGHHGKISFESKEGIGTTFYLTLPLSQQI